MTTMSQARPLDTLRVDLVGSFLRPQALKDAFGANERGTLDDAGLRQAQDAAIRDLVAAEEAHGLPLVGDGEFRRRNFNQSFSVVAGMEPWYAVLFDPNARVVDPNEPKREIGNEFRSPVTSKLRLVRNAPLEEYAFVAGLTTRPATVTLISADRIVQRYDDAKSRSIYPGVPDFLRDVVSIEREMIDGLRDSGCRYVHIDAPSYTSYVDAEMLAGMRSRGEDPDENFTRSLAADNAVIEGFDDVTFGIHLCRGNARSKWHRQGSYDAIAERLFNTLKHDRFLLEYDDERSGGFEPLRFVPAGKVVVLGVISTKTSRVESVDEICRRIDDAAKHLPLAQLAVSPQCGFSSGLEGNLLSEDDQWRKIDAMMTAAQKTWG